MNLRQVGMGFFKYVLGAFGYTCPYCKDGNVPFRVVNNGTLIHLVNGATKACDGINLWRSKGRK